ncbi:protein SEED AND ROOT HAIR PROTECTIVE PROTEIN-like [Macadamia integrifolia]|uniref:protein SEED AND ROOT HAIR PROTECTIVE PROTEIN-like n=1 Tax=Macadamia integrifolia TaxID=60698 RepID=UPI001C4E43CE|nr:protein SEED AND ROOT HAIR PROTECTIVE PROTEIN-like [Macadamia integrifolia]
MALDHLLLIFSSVLLALNVSAYSTGTEYYANGPIPTFEKPKQEQGEHIQTLGIQGLIYCKIGSELTPLKGAIARITCLTSDVNGYEALPFSFLSEVAAKNGYFLATLHLEKVEQKGKLSECKAFLHSSPLKACSIPTNMNKGMTGASPV